MIRRIKLAYSLYNLFHKKQLENNIRLYKQLGLNKSYFSPVSSQDFDHINAELILNQNKPDTLLSDNGIYKNTDVTSQNSIASFQKNGYCIVKNYIDPNVVENVNRIIEDLMNSGKLKFKYGNKLMFAIRKSDYLKSLFEDYDLLQFLSILIQGKAKLFSSINFMKGSQQRSHSDSIHMTTFPLGGLLGVWVALEDIDLENGPLHYYPNSHTLPYYLNSDYDNKGSKFMLGKHDYKAYEKMIESKIESLELKKQVFTANKGDLLVWHANLLHGGEPQIDIQRTRKSMVLHYFDINRICYHEITQRPALMMKAL